MGAILSYVKEKVCTPLQYLQRLRERVSSTMAGTGATKMLQRWLVVVGLLRVLSGAAFCPLGPLNALRGRSLIAPPRTLFLQW